LLLTGKRQMQTFQAIVQGLSKKTKKIKVQNAKLRESPAQRWAGFIILIF
jgi:hypothetical protein